MDRISSFVSLKKKKICSRIILEKGLYKRGTLFEERREEELVVRGCAQVEGRVGRERAKTGDVKCRARAPARS